MIRESCLNASVPLKEASRRKIYVSSTSLWKNNELPHRHPNPNVRRMPRPIRQCCVTCAGGKTHRSKSNVERRKKEACGQNRGFSRKKRLGQSQIQERRTRTSVGNECRADRLDFSASTRIPNQANCVFFGFFLMCRS